MTKLEDIDLLPQDAKACGIYFLVNQGQVVYIGQSKNITQRVAQHRKITSFDEVRFIETPPKRLNAVERKFILEFKPERNGYVTKTGRRDYCAPPGRRERLPKRLTGKELQDVLDRAGKSQVEMAKLIGISDRSMRRYVSGKLPVPIAIKLAVEYFTKYHPELKPGDPLPDRDWGPEE